MTKAHHFLPIAIGIVVENPDEPLESTLQNARAMTDRVFVAIPEGVLHKDIANNDAVKILAVKEEDDESVVRNRLIDKLEEEGKDSWLLWLEPGETIDEATVEDLQRFLREEIDRNFLYVMVLHRIFRSDGIRHDLDEETIEPRLMPLGKGLRFQGRVGASMLPSANALMIGISASPGRILTPPKHRNPELDRWQGEKNLRILSEMEKQGEAIVEEKLALRAESYALIGEFVSARQCFLKLIEKTGQANLRLSAYYDLWETFSTSPIDAGEMTKILLAGLDHFPVDMQLLTFMGAHLQRMGKFDIAARTFETAVRYGQISLDVWHRLHIREIAVTSLALVQRLRGRSADAISVLETNLETIADRTEYNRHLLDLYIAETMEEKAKEFAATMWGDAKLDQMRKVITGACLATDGRWEDAVAPLEEACDAGCADPLCLRWFSLTLLSLLRFAEAIGILKRWIAVQPDNTEAKSYLFAAQHPESFSEIVQTIQKAQLNSLGIAGAELFKKAVSKAGNKEPSKKGNRAIEDAVREMVSSSGSAGRIKGFKPLRDPKPADSVETGTECK